MFAPHRRPLSAVLLVLLLWKDAINLSRTSSPAPRFWGVLGVRRHGDEDLQRHGDARYLCHDVGQGAGRRLQGEQVGEGVQHASHEEDQEVEAGHGQARSSHGVDGTQEEEGEDVLHVVDMSSIGDPEKAI